jgi:hypothetical protein
VKSALSVVKESSQPCAIHRMAVQRKVDHGLLGFHGWNCATSSPIRVIRGIGGQKSTQRASISEMGKTEERESFELNSAAPLRLHVPPV